MKAFIVIFLLLLNAIFVIASAQQNQNAFSYPKPTLSSMSHSARDCNSCCMKHGDACRNGTGFAPACCYHCQC